MRFLLPVVVSWLVAVASASDSGTTPEALHPLAILRKECATCHSEAKRKGGLLIGSRESLLEGGDTDAAIVPGKAKESLLVETLYPDADSHMPPKGQLTPQEIAAIEAWIDKGAEWDAGYWAKLTLPEKAEVAIGKLPVGYGPIFAVALSPDHRRLAVGRGGQIDWYRVEPDGKQPAGFVLALDRSIPAHDDAVQSLAFSPDGKQLASGGFRSVRLWDPAAPEKPVKEFTEPFLGRQTAILHLSEGTRLLVADSLPSQGGRLVEIALDSGAAKTFDNAHLDTVFSLALRADGKQYASTSADKLVTVRDSTTHEIVTRLEGHTGYVLASAFSPEGTRLISAGDDEEIKVWSLESGKKIGALISNRSGPFYALVWLADPAKAKQKAEEKDLEKAKAIATDLIVSIPESGKPAAFSDLKEHEGEQRATKATEKAYETAATALFALAVDPESLWTYAGGEDGRLRVWNAAGKLAQTLDPPTAAPAPAPAPAPPATAPPATAPPATAPPATAPPATAQ